MSAGAGRGAWATPWEEDGGRPGAGEQQDRKRVVGNDRTSFGDPGTRDLESFPPPLILPAHPKLNQPPLLIPPPPFSLLSLPTPFTQQLLDAQLPAAGAGEVVGGEGGGAQLASRGWPNWGSGSPLRSGAELSIISHRV